jgi:hypothetical protein
MGARSGDITHPERRVYDVECFRSSGQFGRAEIQHPHVAIRRTDDVARLDIGVDDAGGLRMCCSAAIWMAPFSTSLRRIRFCGISRSKRLVYRVSLALGVGDFIGRQNLISTKRPRSMSRALSRGTPSGEQQGVG